MSSAVWAGPLLAGAGLLAAAGAAKAARPDDTVRALRQAGLPARRWAVRTLAAVEAVVGLAGATIGGSGPALAVGVSYVALAAFVLVALSRRWPLATCGCFGEPDSPPTVLHVLVDAALGGAALLAGTSGGPSPVALAARRPGWGTAMVALASVVAWLSFLVLSRLPKLRSAA
jgi:methylamine utilization protein MauE